MTRLPGQEDRRSVFATLTQKGSSLLEKVIPEHLANEMALIAGLSKSERLQLSSLLRRWLASLESNELDGRQVHFGMVLLNARASRMKRRAVGLPDVPGILVQAIESGSWAEQMGFRRGDLICEIEKQKVRSLIELRKTLNRPRSHVKRIRVVRGSETVDLSLKP